MSKDPKIFAFFSIFLLSPLDKRIFRLYICTVVQFLNKRSPWSGELLSVFLFFFLGPLGP